MKSISQPELGAAELDSVRGGALSIENIVWRVPLLRWPLPKPDPPPITREYLLQLFRDRGVGRLVNL